MRILIVGFCCAILGLLAAFGLTRSSEVKTVSGKWIGFRTRLIGKRVDTLHVYLLDVPDGAPVQASAQKKLPMDKDGACAEIPVTRYGISPGKSAAVPALTFFLTVYLFACADATYAPMFAYHLPEAVLYAEAAIIAGCLLVRLMRDRTLEWEPFRTAMARVEARRDGTYSPIQKTETPETLDAARQGGRRRALLLAIFIIGLFFVTYTEALDLRLPLQPHATAAALMKYERETRGLSVDFTDNKGTPQHFTVYSGSPLGLRALHDPHIQVIYDPTGQLPPLIDENGWDFVEAALLAVLSVFSLVLIAKTWLHKLSAESL